MIDGHLDIAWNYQSLGRDFIDSAFDSDQLESDELKAMEGHRSVGWPEMSRGSTTAAFASVWVEPADSLQPSMGIKYDSVENAISMAHQQLEYYKRLERKGVRIIRSRSELVECLESTGGFSIMLSIEGADFIRDLADLDFWRSECVTMLAPIWQENRFGGCAVTGRPLTSEGRAFLSAMSDRGMILDISHMSHPAADEALSLYGGCVVASHSACDSIIPGERQISDSQIVRVAQSGGVVGLMLWNRVLNPSRPRWSMSDLFSHMAHIRELTDSWDYVALGSSLDGGFGRECLPPEMRHAGDLSAIAEYMTSVGVEKTAVEKVMHGNWMRVAAASLPERSAS